MKITDKIIAISINPNTTLIDALKKMDLNECKSLLVTLNNTIFHGVLSIGDIQRAILAGIPLDSEVDHILRKNPTIGSEDFTISKVKELMISSRIEFLPIVNSTKEITTIYFWEDLFTQQKLPPKHNFNLPVIIMAGGFGTRLKPLTNVLPKPLIPIGETTMLEEIFSRFNHFGCDDFYISVNYKAELIKYYLDSQKLPYKLSYFQEDKPMGTAGSLSLLKGKFDKTFIVHNCDILIDQDYSEIVDYHLNNKFEITLVAVLKSYSIPYGTIETGVNGELISLSEKPEMTFQINSGMYILEPHLMDEIPEDEFFHITHLIEQVKNRGGKVGVFPISENSWKDIGNWDEYLASFMK
jgi:dTDP-glucose pyrophosphorylase